jgi:hypothetical protein
MGSIITKLDELIADGKLFREARRSQPAVNYFDALDDDGTTPIITSDSGEGRSGEKRVKKEDICG